MKVDGKTADEWRDESRKQYEAREESFERSDTDGFLSQWAHGITGDLARRKAEIAEANGLATFEVLVDEREHLVPSKVIDTKYGRKRVTLDERGSFVHFMATGERAPKKYGLQLAQVEHRATAITEGRGRGLSGTAWVATKPVCEQCESLLDAIGRPCRCGHVTSYTVVGIGREPVNVYLDESEER